jgi:hypothetical protein
VRTVGCFTDGHGRATLAWCSGLTWAAESGTHPLGVTRERVRQLETDALASWLWQPSIAGTPRSDGAASPARFGTTVSTRSRTFCRGWSSCWLG